MAINLPIDKGSTKYQQLMGATPRKLNSYSIAGTIIFLLLFITTINAQTKADLVVQLSHIERVHCMNINEAGTLLATGSEDNSVKLWNTQSGLLIRTFYGLRSGVSGICFTDNDTEIVAGDSRGNLISWNLTGIIIYHKKFGKGIESIEKSHTQNKALLAVDKAVYEMDLATKKTITIIENVDATIAHAIYSSDDKAIAFCKEWSSGDNLGIIKTGKTSWYKMAKSANHISFCSNNQKIGWAYGGYGAGNYGLFNLTTAKPDWLVESTEGGFEAITMLNENVFAVASARRGIITVNANDGRLIKKYEEHEASVSSLLLKNGFIFSSGGDKKIIKWDVATMQPALSIGTKSDYVWALSLGKDGKTLAAACGTIGKEQSIKLWDISTGRFIKRLNELEDDNDIISTCQFSPNQKYIGAGTENGKLVYWQYPETGIASNFQSNNKAIKNITFHPRSNYIAGISKDGKIITQRVKIDVKTVTDIGKGAHSLCFSPDGDFMAIGTADGTTELYDFSSKKKIFEWPTHINVGNFFDTALYIPFGSIFNIGISSDKNSSGNFSSSVNAVAWSSDGKTIAAGGAGRIAWIDAATKKIIGTTEGLNGVTQFVFSPDNNKVAVGCADHNLRIINLITGQITHVLTGHENEVRSVQFTPDGKYVISGSLDSQIKIWELETGKCLLSFITLSASNDFIIYNPDGYYLSSKGAGKVLAFRVGNEVYPFPQFDLKYNRPDIIIETLQKVFGVTDELQPLKEAYKKAYQKRLEKMSFSEADINSADLHLPILAITKTSNNSNSIDAEIKASDSKYMLNRLQVYVDDVPLYGSRGIDVKTQNKKQLTQTINIPLVDGNNNIQLSCINEKGVESLRLPIKAVGKQEGKPNLYIIAISVSKYKDENMNLNYAVKDGRDMLHYFSSLSAQYNIVYADSLFDNNVTIENIALLKNKLLKSNANDAVVVFVSGHGLLDKDNSFYYATHDIDFANPALRGLPYDALENMVDGIPARKKLLLIDACHSGEVDAEMIDTSTTTNVTSEGNIKTTGFRGVSIKTKKKAGLKNSFEMMQELFTNLSQGSGALVISAAAGVGFALESAEWNNGLFTYAVLKTLKDGEGDANKNKHISVNELKTNVTKEVERLSKGRQKPTTRRELLEWDWDLN